MAAAPGGGASLPISPSPLLPSTSPGPVSGSVPATPSLDTMAAIGSSLRNGNSPLILPIAILLYSACQPTTAGIPYIIFLIMFVFVRSKIFQSYVDKTKLNDECLYNLPQYGKTLNINIFVSVFSLTYVFIPMIILKEYNIISILILITYTLTNIGLLHSCYSSTMLIGDIFFGLVSAVVGVFIIIAVNSAMNTKDKNFLFVASSNSSGQKCSMPSKQTFRCQAYVNGQLITQKKSIPD